jgi:hypothetical protein
MIADSQNSSYWPKMEDDIDGPMIMARILRAADKNPRMDREALGALIWERMMGDIIEVVQHCPRTEASRASEALKASLGFVTRDFKTLKQRLKYDKERRSQAKHGALPDLDVEERCLRDADERRTIIAMRLGAICLIFAPDLIEGLSMTDYARVIGVSKQRLDVQIREANEHFKIKGRFQKSEQASLAYSEAQLGNNNRVKNRADTEEEIFGQP